MTQRIDFQQLNREAERLVFTDFIKAEAVLGRLAEALQPDSPSGAWADFHLHAAALANQKYQFDKAAEHFEQAIRRLETSGSAHRLAEARLDLAAVQTNQRDFEAAENCLLAARLFLKKTPDARLRARLVCREGFLRLHEGNYEKAIAQLTQAEQLMTENGEPTALPDLAFLTIVQSGLSDIFQKTGDAENAAAACKRILQIAERNGLRARISWHYLNAGRVFMSLNEAENAIFYLEKAIKTEDDFSLAPRAAALANLGFVRAGLGESAAAHQLFEQAIELYGEPTTAEDFSNLSVVTGWSARLFAAEGQTDRADFEFKKAILLGEQGENRLAVAELCREAADFQATQNDFEQAFFFQKQADALAQQHAAAHVEEKIREFSVRYDAEKRRRQAEVAQLQATGLQLRALRAQMNPHFIFNALNAIQSFLTGGKIEEANQWLVAFSKLMRRALDLSNAESIRLEDEIEFLHNYLEINQKLRFRDGFSFQIEVDNDLETDLLRLPTMMIQPYVENALEHGIKPRGKGQIRVFFFQNEEKMLGCVVEDDGFGVREMTRRQSETPENRRHRSRGREITEQRLDLLHAAAGRRGGGGWVKTLDLAEESGGSAHGTLVEICIPIL